MLAEQTGWTEDFLFWLLPLERVWGYVLCYCRANKVKCRWARGTRTDAEHVADLKSIVRLIR